MGKCEYTSAEIIPTIKERTFDLKTNKNYETHSKFVIFNETFHTLPIRGSCV